MIKFEQDAVVQICESCWSCKLYGVLFCAICMQWLKSHGVKIFGGIVKFIKKNQKKSFNWLLKDIVIWRPREIDSKLYQRFCWKRSCCWWELIWTFVSHDKSLQRPCTKPGNPNKKGLPLFDPIVLCYLPLFNLLKDSHSIVTSGWNYTNYFFKH